MNQISPPVTPIKMSLGKIIAFLVCIVLLGFALGFFPAFLGEDGTLDKGTSQGWRTAVLFSVAVGLMGIMYALTKRMGIPLQLQSAVVFMIGFALMFGGGSWIKGDSDIATRALSGAVAGFCAGLFQYWILARKSQREITH